MADSLKERVSQVLADHVGPALEMDGSRIDVVNVTDGVAELRLNGVCDGCPTSIMTVVMGIEEELRRHIPEIEVVEIHN